MFFKKFFASVLFIGLLGFVQFLVIAHYEVIPYKRYIVSPNKVASTTIALVFGAGLRDDGTAGDMLADRVKTGVSLFKKGKVDAIMMTGDDGRMKSDEVDVMAALAASEGVPKDKILIDHHGYRTYESCYREARVYEYKKVIAVSQSFHLPRIIYLCRYFNIETVGVAADLHSHYDEGLYMNIREVGAQLKAWWQVNITKPLPQELTKD